MAESWQESLKILKDGNLQFLHQKKSKLEHNIEDLQELKEGQNPHAVIICCADSRVSPDIIFNQYIGDLFVIQNAGNVCDTSVLGSVQYALQYLGTPLVVVLGHSLCGAVSAAHKNKQVKGPLKSIVDMIDSHVVATSIDDSIRNHAKQSAEEICKLLEPYESLLEQTVKVLPAYYDICSGEVGWLN